MPRIRQLDREYRKRDFQAEIERCKILRGFSCDKDVAEALEITPVTYSRRKANPEKLTVAELRQWVKVLGIPNESVMAFLGVKAHG